MICNNLFITFRTLTPAIFFLVSGCAAGRLQNIEVLMRLHDWPKAQRALEESIQKSPRDGAAHLLLSEVYAEREMIPQMNATLTRLRSLFPRYEEEADYLAQKYWIKNFKQGNSLLEQKRINEAVPFFQRSTQLDSLNLHSWQRYGDVLFMVRRTSEAERAYRRALELAPHNLIIENNLAEIYFMQQQYGKTILLCDDILQHDAQDLDALQRRAYAHDALGHFERAESDYLKAAALQPSARLFADLGLLYFGQKDYVNAISRFEEALRLSGEQTLLFRHLGEANYRIRNYKEMARWYRKVVASHPDDLVGWKNLAVAYEALGQKEGLARARHYIGHITSTY